VTLLPPKAVRATPSVVDGELAEHDVFGEDVDDSKSLTSFKL